MVLQELVQHVEQVVLDQGLDDQLVQVMLKHTGTGQVRSRPTVTGVRSGVRKGGPGLPGLGSGTGSESGCTP